MKALILAGGFETRLRSITLPTPKFLVEFCNKPIIYYQIGALQRVGVNLIVVAVNHLPEFLEREINILAYELNVKIVFLHEEEPLADPLALVHSYLCQDETPIFVLNSDVICAYPFSEIAEFHKDHGKHLSIAATQVSEPSRYGVLVVENDGKVTKMVEKPTSFISDVINAGIYLINPEVLNYIGLKPTSIECEIIPLLVQLSHMYAYRMKGFWMDIGVPSDYLKGTGLVMNYIREFNPQILSNSSMVSANAIIDSTATIDDDCTIGPNVVIGKYAEISKRVFLTNCTIMSNTKIRAHTFIANSIIGKNCMIGSWVRIENFSDIGDDVCIANDALITQTKVLPNKIIGSSIFRNEIVM